ncbi:MAG TPA: beta-ketoacyl synthase N-terminal-like domain-containing protein, partial [Pseudonocardia sp.]|nr:beta-ketoacyl synthase N-terminal-like domain-containing protein [Pseudonocardia sp.]
AAVPARTPTDGTTGSTDGTADDTGDTSSDADAIPAGDAIAVVGMACRFPGAATPDEFWAALVEGRVSIGPAPAGHRGWGSLWSDADETRAGWLDGVELFDAARFGLPDREARRTDPLQRLLLTVAAEAVESAGHDPASLGSRTGVFVGTIASDFGELVAAADGHSDPHAATGSAMSLLANRLSHVFDWTGPSVALDTACSSSLVALHQAVLQLRAREADAAVVAAANLILTPSKSRSFARNGMLSPRGTCRAFDEGADGYVRGEGAAALVLKRLDDARRDGDPVLAVIRGVAVNHTGASTGFLTAPSRRAQTSVVRSAMDAAGVPPSGVGYVEAHGTGTRLGDLVELEALRDALAAAAPGSVPVGSVKSNVGHLEPAAGLAGLIKTILALQAGCIPGTAGLEVPNSRFRFESSPLFVPGRPVPWDGPRVAGVSSFGFGGVNAHAVLAAAPSTAPAVDAGPQLLVLSAGSARALHLLVERLLLLLRSPHCPPLGPLCATARRRRPRAHRFACIADSVGQLEDKLMLFLAGRRSSRSSHAGTVPADAPPAPTVMVRDGDRAALDDAARRFVAGAVLTVDGARAAVRLPTVPLEERRLWLDPPEPPRTPGTARPGPGPGAGAGPTSGGAREREWTELPEAEGHVVLGERILPGAAYPQKVAELHGSYSFALQDVTFRAVVRPPTTLSGRLSGGGVQFRDGSGALVCDARLLDTMPPAGDVPAAPQGVPSDVAALYRDLERHGLGYGDRFRCVRSLVTGDGVATGELEASGDHDGLDPHLIDGAFQVALAACGVRGLYVPFSVHRLAVHGPLPRRVRVHARRLDRGDDARLATADVTVSDGGTVLLRAERVTWTRLDTARPAPTGAADALATGTPAARNGRTGAAGTTATAPSAASAGSSAPAAGAERPAGGPA